MICVQSNKKVKASVFAARPIYLMSGIVKASLSFLVVEERDVGSFEVDWGVIRGDDGGDVVVEEEAEVLEDVELSGNKCEALSVLILLSWL